MSWKHWTAVVVVIGAGILLQIPRHDPMFIAAGEHMRGAAAPVSSRSAEAVGPYRTVALEVTGMT